MKSSIPAAPRLVAHDWPFPGLSVQDSARSALSKSSAYADLLGSLIHQSGGLVSQAEVLQMVPSDWKELLGPWAHGHLSHQQAQDRGIRATYVGHDCSGEAAGGFHFQYQPES